MFTQTLWQWTKTNKKDIKAHQCLLFFCCPAKRHNHCKSDSRLILLMREILLLQSRCRNAIMASMDRSTCTLTSMSWSELEFTCCELGLREALRTPSGVLFHTWTIYKQNKLGNALRTPSGMLFHTWTVHKPANQVAHLSCPALAEELFPLHCKWSWVLKPILMSRN